jgi:small-conductance mechanosensitive channel
VRATQIKTLTNIDVFIPNENLISENILNYSSDASGSKIQIYVGIAYDSDVVHISKILHDLLEKTPGVIMKDNVGNPITRVVFEKISDYELTIKLAVALENIKKKEIIKSKINAGIIEVFSKHGIKLPYPKNDITIINHKDK